MTSPPSGTVTFLFTDIEGSTRRWEAHPQQMSDALARHDAIVRSAIEEHGGYVFKTMGDAFCAAFHTPHDAVSAALQAQHSLHQAEWPDAIGQVKVRMALHTGVAEQRGGDYFGQPVNRVARLLSAGHGSQVLLSDVTQGLVRDSLPPSVTLLDLGEHHLKDLYRPERICQLVAPNLPREFQPLRTLDNRPNNLPEQLNPFIGREREIASLLDLLRKPGVRLLTLTGPGGTGKTRLSLQVAAEALDDHKDGVWFVNLAPLSDPKLVVPTAAQVLGVKEVGGTPIVETLKAYLKDKDLLLLLDNFEQVENAAPAVADLLRSVPHLKVLVTSRVPLHITGEQEYPVPPLSLPDAKHLPPVETLSQYEAVSLFIQRAQGVKPDFEVTNDNAPAVAEICARLDGLPLAIELAAARIRLLPPQAMLSRLQSRLKLLTGGAKDLPARQQTLRNTIEWSYDLLSEGEKKLFRRLAVFVGGRTLEAVEAVCNADGDLGVDVLEGVQSLVDKSLLQEREGVGGEPRFVMLETIHEFAREELEESGEGEEIKRQHAEYFLDLAEKVAPNMRGAQRRQSLGILEAEHYNLRSALGWAVEQGQTQIGLRLALAAHWYARGYWNEGRQWFDTLLTLSRSDPPNIYRANVLWAAGFLAYSQEDDSVSKSLLEQALQLYNHLEQVEGRTVEITSRIAETVRTLGMLVRATVDSATAEPLFERALALYQEVDNKWGTAVTLRMLSTTAADSGNYELAEERINESLRLAEETGNRQQFAAALEQTAMLVHLRGQYVAAIDMYERCLTLWHEVGDSVEVPYTTVRLAFARYHAGYAMEAVQLFRECLQPFITREERWGIAIVLVGIALSVISSASRERAACLLGAATAIMGNLRYWGLEKHEYQHCLDMSRAQLDEATWQAAWEEGRAMSMNEAIGYALAEPEPENPPRIASSEP